MWNEWPSKSSIPGMPGSFGTCSGPVPMARNCAVNSSPRFVRTIQREPVSSHSSPVTSVWKSALSYSPYCFPIRWQCSRISGAWAYFSVGMWPVSSSSGM